MPTNSKICPDSTCAISVRRKGQILLVVGILVLSTTPAKSLKHASIYRWKTYIKLYFKKVSDKVTHSNGPLMWKMLNRYVKRSEKQKTHQYNGREQKMLPFYRNFLSQELISIFIFFVNIGFNFSILWET